MNNRIPLVLGLLSLVAAISSSCSLIKNNEGDNESVQVLFKADWSALGINPYGCTVILYPEGGSGCIKYRTNSVERFCVAVPPGQYCVVLFNNSENEYGTMTFLDMQDYGKSRVILESISRDWIPKEHGRVVCEPERLAVARCDCFTVRSLAQRRLSLGYEISEETLKELTADSLHLIPEPEFEVLNIELPLKGINNIASIRAYITGMYGGRYLAKDMVVDTSATFILNNWSLVRDEGDYTSGAVVSNIRCFSMPWNEGDDASECTLHLEMMLVDGITVVKKDCRVNGIDRESGRSVASLSIEGGCFTLPDVKPEGGYEGGVDVHFVDWGDPDIFVMPI